LSTRPLSPSLSLLREIAVEASRATSLQGQIDCVVNKVHEAMRAEVCSLYMTEGGKELVMLATVGLDRRVAGRLRLAIGDGLVGSIAARQLAVRLEKASEHPAFHFFPESGEEAFEAFLGVPIVHLGRTLGVLVIQDRAPRVFDNEDEAFLYTVATQLAGSLLRWSKAPVSQRAPLGVERRISGLRGAPGIAVGRLHLVTNELAVAAIDEPGTEPERELERLRDAVRRTLEGLENTRRQLAPSVARDVLDVFDFYKLMLADDEKLVAATEHRIRAGHSAAGALWGAVEECANLFAGLKDPYFRARAEDVHHLGDRLFRALSGDGPAPVADDRTDVVLVGKLVSVGDIAHYRPNQLAGIVSMEGSPYSHTAVLANALGVPAVVDTGEITELFEGETVAIDGYHGVVTLEPGPGMLADYAKLIEQDRALQAEYMSLADQPAVTTDGFRVTLLANTGLLADATPGLRRGAEGVGLYRSEIPFMARNDFPSEDEQVEIYREILTAYAPRPVTMRTLDVGGDKPLPYLELDDEDNPGLGWRGIRFALDNKAMFLTQLRAMLRADSGHGSLSIMLPMVTRVDEVVTSRALLEEAIEQLEREGVPVRRPRFGVMIEAPAAVALLDHFAALVDFVSIGSNDLSQYTLALDRNNPRVANRFDHLHPAVLRTVATVVREAQRLKLAVSLCGEMASDPLAVVALVGLGMETLSMSSFNLPKIKYLIRHLSLERARRCVEEMLQLPDEQSVRVRALAEVESIGLARLVGAG
jgi:phosphotransferase system enzyme I (PtsI)/phosphotransferase system enzyme I (PtsP)